MTTFSTTTLSIMTFSITTNKKRDTLHNGTNYDTQHNSIECHYAECRDYLNGKLSVVMLNVIMLSVVMLNGIMLSVVRLNVVMLSAMAPFSTP